MAFLRLFYFLISNNCCQVSQLSHVFMGLCPKPQQGASPPAPPTAPPALKGAREGQALPLYNSVFGMSYCQGFHKLATPALDNTPHAVFPADSPRLPLSSSSVSDNPLPGNVCENGCRQASISCESSLHKISSCPITACSQFRPCEGERIAGCWRLAK